MPLVTSRPHCTSIARITIMGISRRQSKEKAKSQPLRPVDDYPFVEWESIEQHLDMCENGDLRGDEILHNHGMIEISATRSDVTSVDEMMRNYHFDMSELNREGDEMSGDDHSSGLQGEVQPFVHELNHEAGTPGETSADEEKIQDLEKHRDDSVP